ncbi:hypothetical protein [Pseudonocardia nigra]|uniref:hypothetical protein n=1 Tax=Pseudonocardia nigra TaxID=1921578 RepID=UPI001C5E4E6A|nr:hypothetical protein [Pseudonocardia nigra]
MTGTNDPGMRTAPRRELGTSVLRGALGGLLAGAVFIGLTMWFAASMGNPATQPFLLISTILLGADAMMTGAASVWLGVVVHAVLSIVFGIVFALVAPPFGTNGTTALAGGLYGLLLYVVNFVVLGMTVLPQFQMPNQPFELVVHVVYGHLLALFLYSVGARRGERFLALGTGARPSGASRG